MSAEHPTLSDHARIYDGSMRVGVGVYLASKTAHAGKWRALRAAGYPIICTWIDEPDPTPDAADLWLRCLAESARCVALIVYVEPDEVLKGAFAEIGAALSHGRRVYVVAPNVYEHARGPGRQEQMRRAYPGLSLWSHPNVGSAECVEDAIGEALAEYERKGRPDTGPGHGDGDRS